MNERLKILHLEDLSSDAELINRALKRGKFDFERLVVDTKDNFIKALKDFSPDIILADHSLPSFNSHEALVILQESGINIPFILITANISEDFAVDVLKRGAHDYVLKDRLERLPSAIHNSLEKCHLEKERQNYLDEIIRNEQYYRALIENIHDAIILINENAELIYQSPSAEHITGFAFEHMRDKKIIDYIHTDDRQQWLALFQQVNLRPDIPLPGQYRILHKEGHYIWIEGTITNLMYDESVHAFILNYRDITEKHEAEEILRISESNLQAIFENTSEGFILTDLNGVIKSFNNTSKEIFFLNSGKELIIGQSIFDFVRESTKEIYKAAIPKVLSGEDIQYDLPFERKNGVTKWFSFTINRVDSQGRIDGFSITAKDITQRKEAEYTLRQSEMRYRQIVETAQEGIWMTDENNQTTFVNKKMCGILGYSEKEMLGKPNYFFKDKEEKQAALKQTETGKQEVYEIYDAKFITKSGVYIWANVATNPIYDDNGMYKGALAMISDITGKKKLEELLDKTNNLARIGSWEVDEVNSTLYWSAITKQIHEVDKDFIPEIETAMKFYKNGSSRKLITHAVKELTVKGIPYDLELQIITAKANERWIRIIGKAEFINGKCVKRYGSFQDIDARKRAEIEVLKIYEERNIILESIGDGFYAVDKNWCFTYWNKEAETLLGKKREDVLGKNIWEVYPETINTLSYINYHKAVKENIVQHYQRFNETLHRWAEISAYPSANGLSVYFRDITERIKAENEREIMTSDLIQRNKDLEQFSYIVSHNMRAPVANIIGISSTLQKDGLDDDLKKKVMTGLSTSINKLDEVIKDLNNILKVRRAVDENKKVTGFTKLVNDIRVSIESLIANEQAIFVCDFSAADEMLTIKSYLHSIFYNLISNSIKYRQPGIAPVIEISSQKVNDRIILFFKDNGLGIDLQKRGNQVFGLYKRFHTDYAEGKGLGLYMVKTQVEAIGGKITISSEVNNGTEFKIEFGT